MVSSAPPSSPPPGRRSSDDVGGLQATVRQLQQTVRQLEEERTLRRRRRIQRTLITVSALSVLTHISLIVVLGLIRRPGGAGLTTEPVAFEMTIIQEEELTDLESSDYDDLLPEAIVTDDTATESDPAINLEVPAPMSELEAITTGAMPTLRGAGEGTSDGPALGGAGAATSFFGISSTGTRFAYIVDRSQSMVDGKLQAAVAEMKRSIQSLPDFTYFYIVLFSSDVVEPRMQRGWNQARPSVVGRYVQWLETEVDAGGGTEPRDAFIRVLSLDVRPDVIFFLTDGQVQNFSAEELDALNRRGRRVVINTIAFGADASQSLLKEIARRSGGVYRYVPVRSRP